MTAKQTFINYLAPADIKVNGSRPWDIQVYNPKFYTRVLAGGSLALGESYIDGWWDCRALDQFFYRLLKARLDTKVKDWKQIFHVIKAKILNLQSKSRAYEVGKRHYDIGNDLYKNMLDKRMVYSCGYWKDAKTLDKAQEAKLDLICKKLKLKKGMKVLDIGCGWGSLAKYAAEKYKVKVVGVTVSKEQVKLARELCKGLPIEIRLQDYRKINEQFDRIVSVGMFEHVGYKNYKTYVKVVNRCLKPNRLFLLHTIGRNTSSTTADPWISKYIFPNSVLPSAKQIAAASERMLVLEDWYSFGPDYDKTLMAWHNNFVKNWHKLNYDQRFYRMWKYYLLACAGSFRARSTQVWQVVFSKNGVKEGYRSIR
ncbi:cyclopropane fatty acyl phospholipid synthase [Candidatus Woesearchaeota archaeon]|nr:cyclopropane fatty acyl phospholipid synthase [Candidatus Woesearchaeota archaeon]MBW3005254.1 cyclopropane fatty acyl phospholipid synthase [Candidatus Woesearchaeota archaeon]